MQFFLKCLPRHVQWSCKLILSYLHQLVWLLSYYDGRYLPTGKVSIVQLCLLWDSLISCPAREVSCHWPHMPSLSLTSKANMFADIVHHVCSLYIMCWLYHTVGLVLYLPTRSFVSCSIFLSQHLKKNPLFTYVIWQRCQMDNSCLQLFTSVGHLSHLHSHFDNTNQL